MSARAVQLVVNEDDVVSLRKRAARERGGVGRPRELERPPCRARLDERRDVRDHRGVRELLEREDPQRVGRRRE